MIDPDDKAMLEFVARFAGWRNVKPDRFQSTGMIGERNTIDYYPIPDYLNSVDAWLRDVWPKVVEIGGDLPRLWMHKLELMYTTGPVYVGMKFSNAFNAPARERCLALWRALDGKLPND